DFRMELDSVEFPPLVCDCREGGACRGPDDLETGRQCRDAVAMAHPHLVARSLCPDTLKQRAILLDFQKGAAELAVVPGFHLAAELRAHGLLAITDAEHGNAGGKHGFGRTRGTDLDCGMGAAGKDHGFWPDAPECFVGRLKRHDLAIDAG